MAQVKCFIRLILKLNINFLFVCCELKFVQQNKNVVNTDGIGCLVFHFFFVEDFVWMLRLEILYIRNWSKKTFVSIGETQINKFDANGFLKAYSAQSVFFKEIFTNSKYIISRKFLHRVFLPPKACGLGSNSQTNQKLQFTLHFYIDNLNASPISLSVLSILRYSLC